MISAISLFFSLFLLSCSAAAQPTLPPEFGSRVDRGLVINNDINEASGLAASTQDNDLLWTHNDSGDSTRVFAVGTDGSNRGVWFIKGISARDWEDIASGPGPIDSVGYLYVGEIGDNAAIFEEKRIYRFVEPDVRKNPNGGEVTDVATIRFVYPDGARDAEGLFVDPVTRDIYVVSKREESVRVYRLPWPQSLDTTITAEKVATIDQLTQVTAAAISPDGSEILIKNYTAAYYWHRSVGQTVAEALEGAKLQIPYLFEPQGEAITFEQNGEGYYTVAEEPRGIPARLYYYPRKILSILEDGDKSLPTDVDLKVVD